MTWDGDEYQARFDALAASGVEVHGEANFVLTLERVPESVLDAGCGTGRVAIELTRHGLFVVGVDVDESMLAAAAHAAPAIEWIHHDLASLDLARAFDAVVMAGNVPLFTAPGTHAALVAGCARHLAAGGRLVAGFQLDRGYALANYDADCRATGLVLAERYGTWDRDPFVTGANYAVSVHTRP